MTAMWIPVLWLVAGVLLVAAEAMSGDLVLLMLGAGALGAAGASALGLALGLDAVVFAALSLGLIVLARPALKRAMGTQREIKTNVDALVGARAVTESTVDAHGGRVRIGGDVWSARTLDEQQVIETGRTVLVVEISGATAVVSAEPGGG